MAIASVAEGTSKVIVAPLNKVYQLTFVQVMQNELGKVIEYVLDV